jgi:transcriptional regulator with XRE-family HTH domain
LRVSRESRTFAVMAEATTSRLLGETIREIREQREMTQRQLAEACGVHRVYIVGIEKGRENPSVGMVVKIAVGLQILPSELFRRFSKRVMKEIADTHERAGTIAPRKK